MSPDPMKKPTLLLAISLFAILPACSDAPPPTETAAKKEPEKLEPVTGQSALYKMFQMARGWANDAQVLKLTSLHISEAPDGPPASGAAAAWQATFTSVAKSEARSYTYSIV